MTAAIVRQGTAHYARRGKWFVADGLPFALDRSHAGPDNLLGGHATLDDGLRFIRAMTAPAKALGYVLALYGSTVLYGEGKDIDVLAAPMTPGKGCEALLSMMADHGWNEFGGRTYFGALTFGCMTQFAVSLWHPDFGAWVDLHIREARAVE